MRNRNIPAGASGSPSETSGTCLGGGFIELTLLDNDERTVQDALSEACVTAERARVAVAFAKGSGLGAVPALEQLSARGGQVELLAGVDFQLSDLDAVARFERPPSAARVYVRPDADERVVFHPKVYLLETAESATVIVGSSNLTAGGLVGNLEANVMIRAAPSDPAVVRVRDYHRKLWNSGYAFRLTDRFREDYARLQARRHEVELALRAEADFARAHRQLKLAMVEAITRPSARTGKAWLLITSPDNYIRNIDGKIWGDEKLGRIGRVHTGDLIFFYITTPLKSLGALGMVTSDAYEDQSPYWPDRTYPYRFRFSLLLKPPTPIPLRPLIPTLDLFGQQDDLAWGQRLQRSMVDLTPRDAELLRAALVTAAGAAA